MTGAEIRKDQRWYGRRTGRKLTDARQRLMADCLPALRLGATDDLNDLPALFGGRVRDIWMEIGFGAGEHLAGQAAAHPEVGFIGCEPYINGVASFLAMHQAKGLENVRLFDDDVRLLLPRLAAASLGRLYILFSDPWPKARHHRRRVTASENLAAFARVLRPGGELRFATDQTEFASWTLERVLREARFDWPARRPQDWALRPEDWIETRYERKARAKGYEPVYLNFRRSDESPSKPA